jgi:hypothetical protein
MRSCLVRGSVATTASSVGGLAAIMNLRPPLEVTILFKEQEFFEEKEKVLEMVVVFRIWKLCGVASWRREGEEEEASLNIVAMIVLKLEIEN